MQSTKARKHVVATACALTILLAACSSGSGSTPESDASAPAEDNASEEAAQPANNTEYDCDELTDFVSVIRSATTWLPHVPATGDPSAESLDKIDAAVAALRPLQDFEGLFGTSREGLDNLTADVQAVRDGTFSERSGGYAAIEINQAIVDICFSS